MCEAFTDAMSRAQKNLLSLGDKIQELDIPCRYKGAFMIMADARGFRFQASTLDEMAAIGRTDSDVLIDLLDGKASGLGAAYILATYLDTDKQRAQVLEYLNENGGKRTEKNILKAILAVKR